MPTTPQPIETSYNTLASTKSDYSFISWVRIIAMFSIVAVHCITFPSPSSKLPMRAQANFPLFSLMTSDQATYLLILEQCMRFGTLIFFMVSGFLVGMTLNNNSAWEYYKRRLNTIAVPFLIAFSLYCLYFLKPIFINIILGNTTPDLLYSTADKIGLYLIYTPYWFIPTYFLSLAILLILRQHLLKPWLGVLLISINLFYAFNVHLKLIESRHSQAVIGFILYLWLGYIIARTNAISRSLKVVSNSALVGITILVFGFSLLEVYVLYSAGSWDPVNSLRLSNQLFAISLFFLLARNNYLHRLRFIKPRVESFGIYLYHMFFLVIVVRVLDYFPWLHQFNYQPTHSGFTLVLLSLARGILVLTLTLIFVKILAVSRFRWLIGLHKVR
jgi:peptidoglycan/LPS O-acetylase OafA/YrhL